MSGTLEHPVSELDLKSKIRYETLNALASMGMTSFLISIVNAALAYFTLDNATDSFALKAWAVSIIVLSVLRTVMVHWFWKLEENSSRLGLWTGLYLILIYGSGLAWGLLALLPVFDLADWTETLIIFLIAGMSAGGLVALYPMLRAAVPYLILILLPLIFELSKSGEPAREAMALFASLYLVLLIRATFTLNASATKTIRLEMENNELFKFLLKARH